MNPAVMLVTPESQIPELHLSIDLTAIRTCVDGVGRGVRKLSEEEV